MSKWRWKQIEHESSDDEEDAAEGIFALIDWNNEAAAILILSPLSLAAELGFPKYSGHLKWLEGSAGGDRALVLTQADDPHLMPTATLVPENRELWEELAGETMPDLDAAPAKLEFPPLPETLPKPGMIQPKGWPKYRKGK